MYRIMRKRGQQNNVTNKTSNKEISTPANEKENRLLAEIFSEDMEPKCQRYINLQKLNRQLTKKD